jgi:hypothetical protein
MCRKLGLEYESPNVGERARERNARRHRLIRLVMAKEKSLNVNVDEIPMPPPITEDDTFNRAMDAIRSFELKQMSYAITYG